MFTGMYVCMYTHFPFFFYNIYILSLTILNINEFVRNLPDCKGNISRSREQGTNIFVLLTCSNSPNTLQVQMDLQSKSKALGHLINLKLVFLWPLGDAIVTWFLVLPSCSTIMSIITTSCQEFEVTVHTSPGSTCGTFNRLWLNLIGSQGETLPISVNEGDRHLLPGSVSFTELPAWYSTSMEPKTEFGHL